MRLRVHVLWAFDAAMPDLSPRTESGALPSLQCDNAVSVSFTGMDGREKTNKAMLLKITERDLEIFQKLNAAGWLTTRQIRNGFFPGKSTNAVCKRLRKLVAGKYIGMVRHNSTECALYRLAGQGKLALIEHSNLEAKDINTPTQVPRKLEHFMKVNDLRFSFEQLRGGLNASLLFFFSEREMCLYRQHPGKVSDVLLRLLESYNIIPDALARIRIADQEIARDIDMAIEYDAGTEQAGFFGRTKVQQYARLFTQSQDWLEDFKVLTLTSSVKRIVSLMEQVVYHQAPHHMFYFAPAEKLDQQEWENMELFLDPYDFFIPVRRGSRIDVVEREVGNRAIPKYALVDLPTTSPRSISPREETEKQENP